MEWPGEQRAEEQPAADRELRDTVPLALDVGLPERFRVSRCLGRGGFGTVYQVFDRERGQEVALKILRDPHPDSLFRFKQEFRSLASLRHPHLIEFYDLFEYRQRWFFTMELVSGSTFLSHVRSGNQCDLRRLGSALRDLADALAWLHAYKLVHRDIKPDNVLIDESGRLVLLDFGLAARLSGSAASNTVSVGTPEYMAPEQSSNKAPLGGAADCFAVGVMLYEALTGQLPFTGTMAEMLLAKISVEPKPPSSISPEVPEMWSQLCLRLLAREPEARPDAKELLQWLGEESAARPQPANDVFGREEILSRMLQACESARAGLPQVVELDGPAGYGKSAIMQAFADRVSLDYPDALVLRGRCYEHESLPFKALDALMDDLSRQLRHMGAALDNLLPPEIAALVRLFPVLERVECIARAIQRDPVRIANLTVLRRRAFHAFGSLLEAISSERLVVICLDDLHWGDTDSAALLMQLFSSPTMPTFVLAAAFRTEESTEFRKLWREQFAAAAGRIRHTYLTIGCLHAEASVELACSLLARHGVHNEELASALAAQSGGNPLFLEQLAADLVRSHHAGEALRAVTLTELIHDRISRLSSATREFLRFLAAFGEPLPENMLSRLVQGDGDSATVVAGMVAQNLVRRRLKSGVAEVEIQNHQICEAVLKSVPTTELQAVHIRIAEALIAQADADAGMIAVQFARGGDTTRAAEYAEKAAESAERVLAFHRAAQFYSIALSLGEFDRGRSADLCERLANAHAAAGRGAEAAGAYLRAAEGTESREAKSALRRRAAEEWIRCGNLREGVRVLTSLEAEYDIHHTDSLVRALISIQWSRVLLRVRGLDYKERRIEDVAPRDLARLDVYWSLTEGLSLWNPVIGTRYQMKYLRYAIQVGEPRRVALGLASEGLYVTLAGESAYPRARSILGRAVAVGKRLNDPRVIGTAYAMDAMCGWLTGRWDLAMNRGEEAQRILLENCGGVPWALAVARNAWIGGLLWAGRLNEYAVLLDEFSQDAQERGDLNSFAIYLMNRCPLRLAHDDVPQAQRDLIEVERILAGAWGVGGFHIPHFFGVYGRAQLAIYAGDTATALDVLTRKLPQIRKSYLLRIEVIAVLSLLLEGNLAIACAGSKGGSSADLLRRARRCAKDIRGKSAIWGSGLAMLIEAGADSVEGRTEEASTRWSDAEGELTRSGMLMYAAAARYCRGRLTGDAKVIAAAEEVFREQGVVCIPRLVATLAPGVRASLGMAG